MVENVVVIADNMFPITYEDTVNFSVYKSYEGTHQKVIFESMPTKQYHRSVMLYISGVPQWSPFTCIDIEPADNLETEDISRPLSANMGKVLDEKKADKATIIETVINTPAWSNQPIIDLANNCFVLAGLNAGDGILTENTEVDF